MTLRHLQSEIALEKSYLIRIKLDESNSMSNFLDNGKLNYVKLSLLYKMCPTPFQWVHFWSQTAVASKWQSLWALPQNISGLKGVIVFPKCCWFYAWEHPPRGNIWELWSWTRAWSQGSLGISKCNGLAGDEIWTQLDFTLLVEYRSVCMPWGTAVQGKRDIFFGWFQYILLLGPMFSAHVLITTLEKVNMFPVHGRSCQAWFHVILWK